MGKVKNNSGVKFRGNTKQVLISAVIGIGEVVYAFDTDEWGLGLPDGSVKWRTHGLPELEINLIRGEGYPTTNLGTDGQFYYSINLGKFYSKVGGNWNELIYPMSESVILSTYLPNSPEVEDYGDFFMIPTQHNPDLSPSYSILHSLKFGDITPRQVVVRMETDYHLMPLSPEGKNVLNKTKIENGNSIVTQHGKIRHFNPPTTEPSEVGIIWNRNGKLEISSEPAPILNYCSGEGVFGIYDFTPGDNDGGWDYGYTESTGNGSLVFVSGVELGINQFTWSDRESMHWRLYFNEVTGNPSATWVAISFPENQPFFCENEGEDFTTFSRNAEGQGYEQDLADLMARNGTKRIRITRACTDIRE